MSRILDHRELALVQDLAPYVAELLQEAAVPDSVAGATFDAPLRAFWILS